MSQHYLACYTGVGPCYSRTPTNFNIPFILNHPHLLKRPYYNTITFASYSEQCHERVRRPENLVINLQTTTIAHSFAQSTSIPLTDSKFLMPLIHTGKW